MNKLTKSLMAAGVSLALAFTFSCSDDKGDDGGGGGQPGSQTTGGLTSNLPAAAQSQIQSGVQVYLNEELYTGNDSVFVRVSSYYDWECYRGQCMCYSAPGQSQPCEEKDIYVLLPAGIIQNGKLKLSLPASIDSKYLRSLNDDFNEDGCQGVSVNPSNLRAYETSYLYAPVTSGGSDCDIYFYMKRPDARGSSRGGYIYSSGPGTITGIQTCAYESETYRTNFNLNGSSGWNLYNAYDDKNGMDAISNDLSGVSDLGFELYCSYNPPPPPARACYSDTSPMPGIQICAAREDGETIESCNGMMGMYMTPLESCPPNHKLQCPVLGGGGNNQPFIISLYGDVPQGATCENLGGGEGCSSEPDGSLDGIWEKGELELEIEEDIVFFYDSSSDESILGTITYCDSSGSFSPEEIYDDDIKDFVAIPADMRGTITFDYMLSGNILAISGAQGNSVVPAAALNGQWHR